jgi:hypothetical protein
VVTSRADSPTTGGAWRKPAPGVFGLLALLGGALLLATADGALATALGIAVMELSCISLIASVFRRVGEGGRGRSRAPLSGRKA